MKLLFLYIEEFRVHWQRQISFDGSFVFAYQDGRLSVEKKPGLTEDFFYEAKRAKSRVDCVTAIIGDNGSGKTSIATTLGDVLAPAEEDQLDPIGHYLAIYRANDGTMCCIENLEEVVDFSQPASIFPDAWKHVKRSLNNPRLKEFEPDVKLVYYSPHYSLQTVLNRRTPMAVDLSTGALVREEYKTSYRYYEDAERDRMLRFVKRAGWHRQAMSGNVPLPTPGVVEIRPDEKLVWEVRSRLQSKKGETERFRRFSELLELMHVDDPFFGIVAAFLASCINRQLSNLKPVSDESLSLLYEWGQRLLWDIRRGEGVRCVGRAGGSVLREKWMALTDEERQRIKASALGSFSNVAQIKDGYRAIERDARYAAFARMLRALADLQEVSAGSISKGKWEEGAVCVKVRSPRQQMRMWEFLAAFEKTRLMEDGETIDNYITVDVRGMSSGEMAFLSMMARIDEQLKGRQKVGQIILFLDEAETTLHPSWQQQLLRTLIWYVENFTNGLHVHLVFASHSPQLLSDIPKSNVVLLSRNEQPQDQDEKPLLNTFGANIFDLYRLPFFLHDGPTGAFSNNLIDSMLTEIAKLIKKGSCRKENLSPRSRCVMEQCGDVVLRRYLESLSESSKLC